MPIHLSATEMLLGVGDFLTIYLLDICKELFVKKGTG